MHRSCLLIPVLLLIAAPVFGQSASTDSQAERKQVEESLTQLKGKFASLENEEQQRQTREIEAEDQLRTERAKLGELQDQLDRLEKVLESTNRQSGTNPR